MKQWFKVKFKMSLAAVLTLLVAAIVGTNLINRQHYRELGQSFDSLYKDRLLAANYLYGISYHLNEKHNLGNCATPSMSGALIDQHNLALNRLSQQYEKTTLTTVESKYWQQLKLSLNRYYQLEQQQLQGHPATADLEAAYRLIQQHLMDLQQLQATEGKHLQKSGRNILLSTKATGTAEISLLFVLGLIAVAISSISEQKLFDKKQQQLWN